jgi:hypothetical protein
MLGTKVESPYKISGETRPKFPGFKASDIKPGKFLILKILAHPASIFD